MAATNATPKAREHGARNAFEPKLKETQHFLKQCFKYELKVSLHVKQTLTNNQSLSQDGHLSIGLIFSIYELDGQHSRSGNLTVYTRNRRTQRSALPIVEFDGLHSKSANLTVCTPNRCFGRSAVPIIELKGLHSKSSNLTVGIPGR